MPESVKDRPYRNHEYLFMMTKSKKYYFNKSKLIDHENKMLRSVWSIKNKASKSTIHSATFPEQLVSICLLTSTRKNHLVLDPFAGVGTVGRVCSAIDRRFIGIEINKAFVSRAKIMLKRSDKDKVKSK